MKTFNQILTILAVVIFLVILIYAPENKLDLNPEPRLGRDYTLNITPLSLGYDGIARTTIIFQNKRRTPLTIKTLGISCDGTNYLEMSLNSAVVFPRVKLNIEGEFPDISFDLYSCNPVYDTRLQFAKEP